ncbi:hypothetical protein PPL_08197 [Heterostelium album PN500]|uniref:FNIP repeat-containing protein n=1 Tax=Heterostelium pallidum (strain ATCC 26659 / Pp 5 / PN500) TaxID=670386 RepID=D3BIW2_HETP5|nr:hypothetical protein PPL_08197 [Heterostelium album PN500]EFA78736.1 hypothetical protein PPL_08197 [Heterostelium album PN500]|eukprot:XP_020430860.1 hypothetical protein PPL_08197 [Heterostelium album PN500]
MIANKNYKNNNNSKNNSKIYSFSHLLLAEITNRFENILDKICFSLVCRKWFFERDKYLVLHYNSNKLNNFNFNTFKNQLKYEDPKIVIKGNNNFIIICFVNITNILTLNLKKQTERDGIYKVPITAKELVVYGYEILDNGFFEKLDSLSITSISIINVELKMSAMARSLSIMYASQESDFPKIPDKIHTLRFRKISNRSKKKPTEFPASLRHLEFHTLDVTLPIRLPHSLEVFICYSDDHKPFNFDTTLTPFAPRLHTVFIASDHLDYFCMMTSITTMDIRWLHTPVKRLVSSDLPPSLTNLSISVTNPFVTGYETGLLINNGVLPKSLQHLTLEMNISIESPDVISQLTMLESLKIEMSPQFKIKLPQSLRKLKLPQNFDNAIDVQYILPDNLESLEFGSNFDQKLSKGDLPANLKELILNRAYSAKISVGSLPKYLETLDLCEYDKPIEKKAFPASLRELRHNLTYYASKLKKLPESITSLILDKRLHFRRYTAKCFMVYCENGEAIKGGFTDISLLEKQIILIN